MTREEYMHSQICYIKCGEETGTGFLVSPNQVVTANHVVRDATEDNECVEIWFEPDEKTHEHIKYTLQKSDIDTIQFCSFLTLPESHLFQPLLLRVAADDTEITASTRILRPDAPAPIDSYSFTYKAVSKWLPECGYRANITLEPRANGLSTYSGFSGAPIIVGNCIDGLLTLERTDDQKAVRLYGIVGTAFQNILEEANIHFLPHKENPANPCLFKPEKYSEYLLDCLNRSSSLPLETQVYLQDRPLFDELNKFVFDKWYHQLLADLRLDNDTNKLLKGFIDEIGNFESMEKITASLKSKVQSALDCKTIPQNFRVSIMNKLDSPLYNDCMFISGYFGSGKTRLAIEAARSMCPLHYKPNSPVFLFVQPSVPSKLDACLVHAFKELLGSTNTLSEYLDAFANHTLVIVLDDVHEYFQSGIVMKDLRDLIIAHSRPYVKWMIMMQTGAGTDTNNLYNNYFARYAHTWSRSLSYFLIGPWFQLDDWYRHQDLPAQMLQERLSVPLHSWIWKNSVSSTIYYNPLLIDVLLTYEKDNNGQSIFTYNNFLFPAFCHTFFHLLSKGDLSVKRNAESISRHLQTVHSLRFHAVPGISHQQIDVMLKCGLIVDTNEYPTSYKSVPDIVWYNLIAAIMNAEFPLNGQNIRTILQNMYWENNPSDFNNILSIWVLSGERSSDDMIRIWKTLFDCHFEQIALDSGFKCDPFLRNELIRIALKHTRALRQHFSLVMHLCALGQIEKKLFYKLISVCIEKCADQLKNNTELFTYMLLQNYQTMCWENVLETLSYLAPILKIDANVDFICRLGRDIGRTVAQKADMVNQLDKAIRNACAACNGDVSNKKYSPPDEQYHSFPVELFDGFCSDFCNTIIQEYNIEGYEKFNAAGWYSYEKKTKPNQYRRNLALTFALAHEYRYQIQAYQDEDDYVYWYKFKLVKPLSEGDVTHKKFALYLIIHTELRENHYKIEENGFFWKIADTLRRDKSMRDVLEGNTCKTFYKYNFDGQTYSPKYRDNHYQRRGRKRRGKK